MFAFSFSLSSLNLSTLLRNIPAEVHNKYKFSACKGNIKHMTFILSAMSKQVIHSLENISTVYTVVIITVPDHIIDFENGKVR